MVPEMQNLLLSSPNFESMVTQSQILARKESLHMISELCKAVLLRQLKMNAR